MDKEEFSAFVRKARAKADMTQWEFGEAIGVSWITIYRWEQELSMPKPDAIDFWIREVKKV